MEEELLRIVHTYGNHPSFCLMTLGNEHEGAGDTLDYWVQMLIREDPRHFYTSASAGQIDGPPTIHRRRPAAYRGRGPTAISAAKSPGRTGR